MQRLTTHPRFFDRDVERADLLTGGKLTKYGRERDSQRQRLYDAEHSLRDKPGFNVSFTQRDLYRLSRIIRQSPFWLEHGGPDDIEITISSRRYASSGADLHNHEIRLAPGWGTCACVIFHELSHFLTPPPHAHHGPLFALRFLQLIAIGLGQPCADQLRLAFDTHHVSYAPC